jgi:hypothetical protein
MVAKTGHNEEDQPSVTQPGGSAVFISNTADITLITIQYFKFLYLYKYSIWLPPVYTPVKFHFLLHFA